MITCFHSLLFSIDRGMHSVQVTQNRKVNAINIIFAYREHKQRSQTILLVFTYATITFVDEVKFVHLWLEILLVE